LLIVIVLQTTRTTQRSSELVSSGRESPRRSAHSESQFFSRTQDDQVLRPQGV